MVTAKELEECGVPLHLAGAVKMELIAVNTTMFYVRLENLADSDFDTFYTYYEHNENDTEIDIPIEDEPEITVIPKYVDLD